MILHIFRTKVMNRGLNSKRLVKKILKNASLGPSQEGRRSLQATRLLRNRLHGEIHNTPSPTALSLWLWRAPTAGARRRGCGVIFYGIGWG